MLERIGGKYEIASIAPALRSCFPEYRVPKLSRRSHGVMKKLALTVWTMWENSLIKMTTATLFWRKTKSERCWRRRGNKNDKKSQKKDYVEVSESRRSQRRLPQRGSSARKLRS